MDKHLARGDPLARAGFVWNADRRRHEIPIPRKANIALDTVTAAARLHPDRTALIHEAASGDVTRYSFAEIDRLSDRVAAGLAALGVGPGDPVAVQTGQSPETAIAHMAIYKLGAVVLTLSHLYGTDTVRHIVSDSGTRIILTDRDTWDGLAAVHDALSGLGHVIVTGGARGAEIPFDTLLQTSADGFTPVATDRDDPALLMYTSGSTGMPKGMLHAHRVIHAYQPTVSMFYDLELTDPGLVFWSPADWAWVGGLLDLLLPAWMAGQTVVASQHRFDAERAFDLMERHGVTHAFMAPTALKRLAEIPDPKARWTLGLRVVCTGGESLPGQVLQWVEQALGVSCNEFYGLTEFNHMVGNCKALYPSVPGSMGRAYPGRRVAIIDDEGNEVADGTVGQIASWLPDDPSVFLGYRGSPGVPQKLLMGQWLCSGDLALRDENGYFWYQGRADDLIKSSGYRIGPAEVEDALLRHPAVAEAAVIGKPDPDRGAIVKAFVRLMPGAEPGETLIRDLQQSVKTTLAAYKYPREIEFVDSFPLTNSGKIKRRELRQREIDRPGTG